MLKDSVWKEMVNDIVPEIHKGLKNRIDASIYVTIQNNQIVVKIAKFGLRWTYEVPNASDTILYGGLCNVINTIVREYRKHVTTMYFY